MMSESELTQLQAVLSRVLDEQERNNPRPGNTKGEKWFTLGVMTAMLAVTMFIGKTVWDNSLKITRIDQQVSSLTSNMGDRFTGTQGNALIVRMDKLEALVTKSVDTVHFIQNEVTSHIAKDEYQFESYKEGHHVIHEQIDNTLHGVNRAK